jgi:hypothetical protein
MDYLTIDEVLDVLTRAKAIYGGIAPVFCNGRTLDAATIDRNGVLLGRCVVGGCTGVNLLTENLIPAPSEDD